MKVGGSLYINVSPKATLVVRRFERERWHVLCYATPISTFADTPSATWPEPSFQFVCDRSAARGIALAFLSRER
jgi:hypothetical protein